MADKKNFFYRIFLSDSYSKLNRATESQELAEQYFNDIWKENPTSEVAFTYLSVLIMERDVDQGRKFFKKYKNLTLEFEDLRLIQEVLEGSYFSEENVEFVMQSVKKHHETNQKK